ncbi:hypothetical protein [Sphingosinithalassobacter sp. LHW66-3]|uniref:hypothetical protein n=1 Tax=Sphingosinithalassobacter sp. LHW66-3 TaxID=3424718 RepID=UPI003D6B88B0
MLGHLGTRLIAQITPDELLDPALVSPALLPMVADEAPSRTVLCAGAGHFAAANVTLTQGVQIGAEADTGAQLLECWDQVTDRTNEFVPAYGFFQAERELASAGAGIEAVVARG